MTGKDKLKPPPYTIDFVTALPVEACLQRLDRDVRLRVSGWGGWLAPITQRAMVRESGTFVIERTYPGAIHPIRLAGDLDPDEAGQGTWVHGAITHDTYNQVLIEGLVVFVVFFLLAVLLFLRLKTRGVVISLPLLLLMLALFGARWRALRESTEELGRWVRRKLYVTPEQVKRAKPG